VRLLRFTALAALLAVAVPALADKPEEGKPAPDVTLPAVNVGKVLPGKEGAKTLSLKDIKGKNVVLFFFPKAMTRG
jgi:peroxiredoxin